MLFDTCVDTEDIGPKCLQPMHPVRLPKFATCITASAGFNHNDFNITNAVIRVVKMDSHRAEPSSFHRGNMVGKAETQLGPPSPPHIVYHISYTRLHYTTSGASHRDPALTVQARPAPRPLTSRAGPRHKQVSHLERSHPKHPCDSRSVTSRSLLALGSPARTNTSPRPRGRRKATKGVQNSHAITHDRRKLGQPGVTSCDQGNSAKKGPPVNPGSQEGATGAGGTDGPVDGQQQIIYWDIAEWSSASDNWVVRMWVWIWIFIPL